MHTSLQQLMATLEQPQATEAQLQTAANNFYNSLDIASTEEIQSAVATLATALDFDNLTHAGQAAMVIGALIHQGFDPTPASEPLIARLDYLLTMCGRMVAAVELELDKTAGSIDREEENLFERTLCQLAPTRQIEMEAWQALAEFFYLPGVELFCSNAQARRAGVYLRDTTKQIAHYHSGAYWLDRVLSVLFEEPILVIEPNTQLGFEGKMSGVADNFQLHTLLMDIFPHKQPWNIRRRVARQAVEIAQGKGAQSGDTAIVGTWNLYNWYAVGADLKLPDLSDRSSSQYWIWGEGCPEEIAVFSGFRVILLGAPSYSRSFGSQRAFASLPAQITCDRFLNRAEVAAWLAMMAASN
jgi:hypothetical protein